MITREACFALARLTPQPLIKRVSLHKSEKSEKSFFCYGYISEISSLHYLKYKENYSLSSILLHIKIIQIRITFSIFLSEKQ